MEEAGNGQYDSGESGDYSRFGIPDAPKTTVTTPFGKAKTCAGLLPKERWFLVLSFINILAAIGLTAYRLVVVAKDDPTNSDFTFTILIIVNAAFVAFYVLHGVLRERKYELYVQIVAILVILIYCIVEYAVKTDTRTTVKLVRLIIACVLAPPNIILSVFVARDFGELEFRIAGASAHLQRIYNEAAIFSCWLKFDLQVTVSLVILALQDGTKIDTLEIVTLAVGIPYTFLWDVFGWFVLRLELGFGAFVFAALGLAKPAYYVYKFVELYRDLETHTHNNIITYCVIICGALAVLVWLILMVELVRVFRNFGKGLKERGRISFGAFTLGQALGTPN
ncbi:uncharacterized protein LOC123530012 [Mercenaria mercenaria]|uniref:uncharacterized protein LOC123530012 n=1 Tax=Mercenaria mercenaria TaxID=6596 RepID=UPI001E1DABC5|nr:uncharacterized protein LOC123530012 [Mercenaria mercenaria]